MSEWSEIDYMKSRFRSVIGQVKAIHNGKDEDAVNVWKRGSVLHRIQAPECRTGQFFFMLPMISPGYIQLFFQE